jgi:hypothetical protein
LVYHRKHGWCQQGVLLRSVLSTQLHTRRSWWQDDVPCTGCCQSPVRAYIHNAVIRWHRCVCVPPLPHHSQLE